MEMVQDKIQDHICLYSRGTGGVHSRWVSYVSPVPHAPPLGTHRVLTLGSGCKDFHGTPSIINLGRHTYWLNLGTKFMYQQSTRKRSPVSNTLNFLCSIHFMNREPYTTRKSFHLTKITQPKIILNYNCNTILFTEGQMFSERIKSRINYYR